MKKIFLLLMAFCELCACAVYGQDITSYDVRELEYVPVSAPDFDWSQFEEKQIKAVVGKKGIELESKEENVPCLSICELPINMESEDFIVALKMSPESVDDKKPFGMVYDYRNEANYKMLAVMKKGFQIIEYEKGEPSIVKKSIYKGKGKDFIISITRDKNKVYFGINGMNLTTQINTKLEYPVFGFVIASKGKLLGKSIAFKKVRAKEHEEQ